MLRVVVGLMFLVAWVTSPAFAHGHRSAAERAGDPAQPPVGVHSEVWSSMTMA
jgi:hypothetical protein